MFDQIEKLKEQYTDKYVVITADRPELRRFDGYTGQVKTVNMNGQALVEFNQFNNIAWYDINPVYLRVVDKPVEGAPAKAPAEKKEPAAKAAKPAAGEKKLSPLEMARMQGAAKPAGAAPAAGKSSTADILAAARANKAGGAAPAAKAPAGEGKKPSTADILAAARAKKAPSDAAEAAAEETPVAEAPAAKPKAKPAAGGALPTTTADKIAWMRARDSK